MIDAPLCFSMNETLCLNVVSHKASRTKPFLMRLRRGSVVCALLPGAKTRVWECENYSITSAHWSFARHMRQFSCPATRVTPLGFSHSRHFRASGFDPESTQKTCNQSGISDRLGCARALVTWPTKKAALTPTVFVQGVLQTNKHLLQHATNQSHNTTHGVSPSYLRTLFAHAEVVALRAAVRHPSARLLAHRTLRPASRTLRGLDARGLLRRCRE